jgi:hypothetical protein
LHCARQQHAQQLRPEREKRERQHDGLQQEHDGERDQRSAAFSTMARMRSTRSRTSISAFADSHQRAI